MPVSRSFTTAIALALVTGCAREEAPAASPVVPVVASPDTTADDADPAVQAARLSREREVLAANAPARISGDTLSLGSVRIGNQRPLGPVAVAFATYLNKIHGPIHREFSDKGLDHLDTLPSTHPLNNSKLVTRVELVLDGATGELTKVTVVKPSGVTEFDTLAVDSVTHAAPFGEAPVGIRSADGNVYVHWEFARDATLGCSTMHVRPFLLGPDPKAVKP